MNKIIRTEVGFKNFMNESIKQYNKEYKADVKEVDIPIIFATKSEMNNALGGYVYEHDMMTGESKSYCFEFLKKMINNLTEEHLRTILLHELGHYVTTELFGGQCNGGHSRKWEMICERLGLEEIAPTIKLSSKELGQKYTIYCPSCGKELGGEDRMTKRKKDNFNNGNYHCMLCGNNHLEVRENY